MRCNNVCQRKMTDHLAKIGQLNNTAQLTTQSVLIKTLTTCIEMLKDRGYVNIQACQTVEEITQNMVDTRYIVSGSGTENIQIYFHNEDRVGVKQLRTWVENSMADKIIIVSLEGPTAFTRKEAESSYEKVQFFTFRELCVNIMHHILVPKHERVTENEVPYRLSKSRAELPILSMSDKVAQYYAYEPGDIIRITRTAGVQEPIYFYRIVRNMSSQ